MANFIDKKTTPDATDAAADPEATISDASKSTDCPSKKTEFIFKIPTKPAPKTLAKKLAEKLLAQAEADLLSKPIPKDDKIVWIPRDRLQDPQPLKKTNSSYSISRNRDTSHRHSTADRVLRDPGPKSNARTHNPRYYQNSTSKFSNNYSRSYQSTRDRLPFPRHTCKRDFNPNPNHRITKKSIFERLGTPLRSSRPHFNQNTGGRFQTFRPNHVKNSSSSFNEPRRSRVVFPREPESTNWKNNRHPEDRTKPSASRGQYSSTNSRFGYQNERNGPVSHYREQRSTPTFRNQFTRNSRDYRNKHI